MKVSLIGAGGMANEICSFLAKNDIDYLYDGTIEEYQLKNGHFISPVFRKENHHTIAVGYPETKVKIIKNIKEEININEEIKWSEPLLHKHIVRGESVFFGYGSVIYPFCTFTSHIEVGNLASINSNVTIGHDCIIGDMFHASPGTTISGNVTIGDRVFMGANSVIKEKINICDDVIIGAGAVVVKNITEKGKYAGNPAKKL